MAKKTQPTEPVFEGLTATFTFREEKKHSWLLDADDPNGPIKTIYLMKTHAKTRPNQVLMVLKITCIAAFLFSTSTLIGCATPILHESQDGDHVAFNGAVVDIARERQRALTASIGEAAWHALGN